MSINYHRQQTRIAEQPSTSAPHKATTELAHTLALKTVCALALHQRQGVAVTVLTSRSDSRKQGPSLSATAVPDAALGPSRKYCGRAARWLAEAADATALLLLRGPGTSAFPRAPSRRLYKPHSGQLQVC